MHSDLKFLTSEMVRNERLLFKPPSLTYYGGLNGLRHIPSVPIYNWFIRNRLLNAAGKDNSLQLHTGAWIDGSEIYLYKPGSPSKGHSVLSKAATHLLCCPVYLLGCLRLEIKR